MNRLLTWIRGGDTTPCTTCGHPAGSHHELGIDIPCTVTNCGCLDLQTAKNAPAIAT